VAAIIVKALLFIKVLGQVY